MDPATKARTLARQSDEQLSRRLALGEAAAFDELYRRYRHGLAAYGAHLLGDAAAGEDVAQVALLNAHRSLRSGTQPDRLRPWLYRVAHNAALDLLDRRVFPVAEPRPIDSAAPETSPSLPSGALVAALGQLSNRQRRVYLLREVHGLRIAEIASTLSLTPAQVEQTLFAARNGLAETLVFGGRLDCEAVHRLSAGPLDWREQRALQRHLRACPACREVVPRRRGALLLLPFLPIDWLRRQLMRAGSWGPTAKVGALGATAVVVAAPPLAALQLHHASHRARLVPTRTASAGSAHGTALRKRGATIGASSPLASRQPGGPSDETVASTSTKTPVAPTDRAPAASAQVTTTASRDQGTTSAPPAQPAEQPEASEAQNPEAG